MGFKFKTNITILLALSVIVLLLFILSSINRLSVEHIRNLTGGGHIPTLYIDTFAGRKITRNNYITAVYEIDGLRGGCEIRGRGNTTWVTRELYKKPYLLKLSEEMPLMGMKSSQKWVLMANTTDKTSLRNRYGRYLAKEIWDRQKWTPNGKFVSLFLNGKYNGIYELTEQIRYEKLDLPNPDSFLALVNGRQNKEWNFTTEQDVDVSIHMKGKTEEEYQAMEKIIQNAEDVLYSDNFKSRNKGWRCVMDEDSFIDWYLINEFLKNTDAAFHESCYFFYDSSQKKLFMGPVWDMDISCGNLNYNECSEPEGFWINQSKWYKRLFEDESFVEATAQRYREKRNEIEASFEWIRKEATTLKPNVEINDLLWHNIGHRQWPHAPGWKNRKTYESEVDYMVDFLQKRAEWLDKEFS